jgi:hypothetical protein
MNTDAQTFLDYFTTAATHLACALWIYLYALSTSIFRFVSSVVYKLTPRCVCDGFSKTVILEHPAYIQRFKYNDSKSVYKLPAFLMGKVTAFVRYTLVYASNYFSPLLSLWRAFLSCVHFSLSFCKFLFFQAEESRIGDRFTCRQHGKFFQPAVNPCLSKCQRLGFSFTLNRKASVPFARRCPRDGERFDFPFYGAMQFDFHPTDFTEPEFAMLDCKSRLRKGEAVISRARTKTREARFLACFDAAKKSVKGFIQPPQHFLQHLRVNPVQIRANLFDVGELVYLIVASDGFAADAISVTPFLQSRVVEFATKPKRAFKSSDLSVAWVDAIFESFEHLPDSLRFDIRSDILQMSTLEVKKKVLQKSTYCKLIFFAAFGIVGNYGQGGFSGSRRCAAQGYRKPVCSFSRNRTGLSYLSSHLERPAIANRLKHSRQALRRLEGQAGSAIRVHGRLNNKAEVSAKHQYYRSENHSRFALLRQERRRREIHPPPKGRGLLSQLDKETIGRSRLRDERSSFVARRTARALGAAVGQWRKQMNRSLTGE